MYKSKFNPSESANSLLQNGNIAGRVEKGHDVIERVVEALLTEDYEYANKKEADIFANSLGRRMDDGRIVMSTTILTNAGRYLERPLSACIMPTSNLYSDNIEKIKEEMDKLHLPRDGDRI